MRFCWRRHRAGADVVITYFAKDAARLLRKGEPYA